MAAHTFKASGYAGGYLLINPLLVIFSVGITDSAPKKKDPIEQGLREAYDEYKKKNYGQVSDKLRELIKLLEAKNEKRAEVVLPEKVKDWQADQGFSPSG